LEDEKGSKLVSGVRKNTQPEETLLPGKPEGGGSHNHDRQGQMKKGRAAAKGDKLGKNDIFGSPTGKECRKETQGCTKKKVTKIKIGTLKKYPEKKHVEVLQKKAKIHEGICL